MAITKDGIVVVGDQTIGYTERQIYLCWDITPDTMTERTVTILKPYYSLNTTRSIFYKRIQYLYMTRWVHVEYAPIPITERTIYMHYAKCMISERTVYYYLETQERLAFFEGLLTTTPLLIKYPKYFNWSYVPQVLTPEFTIWSFYELNTNDINLKVVGDTGTVIFLNSGVHSENFTVSQLTDKQYHITVRIDHVFEPNEVVNLYLTAYDEKGNVLKPGMW